MEHRKQGARLLGLMVAAALGVTVFAASAQAVAPGFLINKKPVGALKAVAVAKQIGVGSFLVPGLNFQLSCTTVVVDEGVVESNTVAKMAVLNTGCTVLSISKFPEEIHCHVKEPIKVEALLLPAELKKPVLDAPAVLAEKIKALIMLHLPEAGQLGVSSPCVLPLDNVITGEVCVEIKNNDTVEPLTFSNASTECLERPALEALTEGAGVKDVLKYGAQTAIIDGSSHLSLIGAHTGLTMGVSLY
jgi:hypothetical protein